MQISKQIKCNCKQTYAKCLVQNQDIFFSLQHNCKRALFFFISQIIVDIELSCMFLILFYNLDVIRVWHTGSNSKSTPDDSTTYLVSDSKS